VENFCSKKTCIVARPAASKACLEAIASKYCHTMCSQRQISPAANFGITIISKVCDVQTKIQDFPVKAPVAVAFGVYYAFGDFCQLLGNAWV